MVEHVREDDPRITAQETTYKGTTGTIKGHLAKPKEIDKLPGIIVIHENRGLTPHIKEVARRFSLEGYIALAPDALSSSGGTPKDRDQARDQIYQLDMEKTVMDFVAAVEYLKNLPESTGKIGVTGFCWGGGVTNQVAVKSKDVTAAAPFYGIQPDTEDVPKIQASMLLHYAGDDERINAGIDEYVKALREADISYEVIIYEGAKHAFFNDTSERYHKEAAEKAWKETLRFFEEHLKP